MPQNKDLKRVVRTRMAKTGESYTAAREQIIRKSQNPVEVASEAAAPLDYAALAGQTDATMVEKTGRSWTEWTRELDGHGASALKHGGDRGDPDRHVRHPRLVVTDTRRGL